MLKKRVIILINNENGDWWLKTFKIYFWKSKTKFLNEVILTHLSKTNNRKITNIQMY